MDGRASSPAGSGAPGTRAVAALGGRSAQAKRRAAKPAAHPRRRLDAERRLVRRVFAACDPVIQAVCAYSSVPAEFLGALTANESGGNAAAARFEPAVYGHLKALAEGRGPAFGSLRRAELDAEIDEMLHPKAAAFHARYLTSDFAAAHRTELAARRDEALRELAASWGYTQIMGYHLVGRAGTVRDLLEPRYHYRLALELLAEFAEHYQLDLTREFAEMFRCWNTGQPYGETYDPDYVAHGLRRMELYREAASALPDLAIE
jgi:hypothetical protein